MSSSDDPRDDAGKAGPCEPELPYDEDAVWRSIIENYGERPTLDDDEPAAPAEAPSRDVFDRSFLDAQAAAEPQPQPWTDEGHFVPPEPPPLPRTTPIRRLAWFGLFGAPALMLLAVVFGWAYPSWLALLLVVGFVGGFVYLVATMPRNRGDWPGDDGAVV